jgi:RNA polymerase-binding transcription factor DksA
MITKIDHFKKKLEEERMQLEAGLSRIAKQNPENPEDWEPTSPKMNVMVSDKSELADTFEELEGQAQIEVRLEQRLNEVKAALKRMEEGRYGKCEVDGKEISEKRLETNPAARTCIKHAKPTSGV